MNDPIFKRTQLYRQFNGASEMIAGRLQGPWVVLAHLGEHSGDIETIIFGGIWASHGINVGDHDVARAGDDWRPLLTKVVTEMQLQTGRPICLDCSRIFGVDDDEMLAVAREAFAFPAAQGRRAEAIATLAEIGITEPPPP